MRDALVISLVIGVMVTVMSSMMAFFALGTEVDEIGNALRTGLIIGGASGAVELMFARARYSNNTDKIDTRGADRAAEVVDLRGALTHLDEATDGS